MVQRWPKWAQRHIVLGLDLQGGSHILLEVDAAAVRKEKLEQLRDDVRRVLRDARVGLQRAAVVRGNTVEVRDPRKPTCRQALTKLRELSQPLGGLLGTTGQRSVDIVRRRRRPDPAHAHRAGHASSASARRSTSRSRSSSGASTSSAPSSRRSSARASTASWCRCPACRIRTRLKELLGKTAKLISAWSTSR